MAPGAPSLPAIGRDVPSTGTRSTDTGGGDVAGGVGLGVSSGGLGSSDGRAACSDGVSAGDEGLDDGSVPSAQALTIAAIRMAAAHPDPRCRALRSRNSRSSLVGGETRRSPAV
jgi:hypothetical protein